MKTVTKEEQAAMSPIAALELLKEGNQRFVNNKAVTRDLLQQASETVGGQYPFATILSCIDSRTSAELIFDQGIGDIFSIRIAGNIVNEDILGSMEFACKVAGSKVLVVMGHTHCGAVKGACDGVELGNLTTLLSKVKPAIDAEITETERNSGNGEFVQKVTNLNVRKTVDLIMERSPLLKEQIQEGQIAIIGAVHDISTGAVNFFDDTYKAN